MTEMICNEGTPPVSANSSPETLMYFPPALPGTCATLFSLVLLSGSGASAQGSLPEDPLAPSPGDRRSQAFTGFVFTDDGLPAEGAVVVTSVGGRALVDLSLIHI